MSAIFALCQIRGHRALCRSVGTESLNVKIKQAGLAQRGLPCGNNQEGPRWILAEACVFVRERDAESQLLVSLFLFLVILLPPLSVILFIIVFCFPALFLILRHDLNFFPQGFHQYFSHLFNQTKQPINLLNNLRLLLNVSHWSNITVRQYLRHSLRFGLPLCPWVAPVTNWTECAATLWLR